MQCDADSIGNSDQLDSDTLKLLSITPENNTILPAFNGMVLELVFDRDVIYNKKEGEDVYFTEGTATVSSVNNKDNVITLIINDLKWNTKYELLIPKGVISGVDGSNIDDISFVFKTHSLEKSLVNENATDEVKKIYAELYENYGKKIISGTMAVCDWNTEYAQSVTEQLGNTPLLNCFDYIHMYLSSSETNAWIDYTDITPVKEWNDRGGLVSLIWHWNVPTSEPNSLKEHVIWNSDIVIAYWDPSLPLIDVDYDEFDFDINNFKDP